MKKLSWWLFLAILVSLVFGFYHLMIPRWLNTDYYSPLVFNDQATSFTVDEANAYAPQVREFFDGNLWQSDSLVWEYKNSPSPFKSNIVPIWIMGGLAKLTGGVKEGFILADFIWPPIVFLSLSYFIYLLTKKFFLAPVGALITMFFFRYFNYLPYGPSIIKSIIDAPVTGSFSVFIRSFHPQVTFSFFIIFCLCLWQNKKPWLVGLSLGLLFYTYVYYWTFALGWLSLMIAWAFLAKQFSWLKKLLLALIIALILAGPYFWELWQFQQLAISQAFGASYRFLPQIGIKAMITVVIMLGVSRLTIKDKYEAMFWQSLYLTGVILVAMVYWLNLSVDDPFGHWLDRAIYPLSTILLSVLTMRKLKKDYKVIGICLSLILLAYQGRSHWVYFKNSAEIFQLEPERQEVFNWLNNHTPKDSVVITTSLTDNLYLPVYTHNNLFAPFSYLTLAPQSENLERFLIAYRAINIPDERIKNMFSLTETNQQFRAKKRFHFDDCGGHYIFYRLFVGADFYNCSVPSEKLEIILSDYQTINADLEQWKQKYRMDYWLWGPYEKQWARINPETDKNWKLLWQNNNYRVYKI